jgi:hypothetical protein
MPDLPGEDVPMASLRLPVLGFRRVRAGRDWRAVARRRRLGFASPRGGLGQRQLTAFTIARGKGQKQCYIAIEYMAHLIFGLYRVRLIQLFHYEPTNQLLGSTHKQLQAPRKKRGVTQAQLCALVGVSQVC